MTYNSISIFSLITTRNSTRSARPFKGKLTNCFTDLSPPKKKKKVHTTTPPHMNRFFFCFFRCFHCVIHEHMRTQQQKQKQKSENICERGKVQCERELWINFWSCSKFKNEIRTSVNVKGMSFLTWLRAVSQDEAKCILLRQGRLCTAFAKASTERRLKNFELLLFEEYFMWRHYLKCQFFSKTGLSLSLSVIQHFQISKIGGG